MKKLLIFITTFLILPSFLLFAQVVLDNPKTTQSISVNNKIRHYIIHIPKTLDKNKKYPLVVDIHGFMETAYGEMELSGFKDLADKEHFIVLYPVGNAVNLKSTPVKVQCFDGGPRCCGGESVSNANDIEYFKKLIDYVTNKYPVDVNRIYVVGLSNGSAMAQRLAVELPNIFAGVVGYSHFLLVKPTENTKPIPYIV